MVSVNVYKIVCHEGNDLVCSVPIPGYSVSADNWWYGSENKRSEKQKLTDSVNFVVLKQRPNHCVTNHDRWNIQSLELQRSKPDWL